MQQSGKSFSKKRSENICSDKQHPHPTLLLGRIFWPVSSGPLYKPVSQSCAVAKSEHFWRATGQSNLADRMEDCSIRQSAVV